MARIAPLGQRLERWKRTIEAFRPELEKRGYLPPSTRDTLIIERSKKKVKKPSKSELERMEREEFIRKNPGRTA